MANLVGHYHVHKSELVNQADPSLSLLIRHRINPTAYKPANFILRPLPGGRAEYLSSMFPLNVGPVSSREAYSLDYRGQYLVLEVDRIRETALIRHREPGEYSRIPAKTASRSEEKPTATGRIYRIRMPRMPKLPDNQSNRPKNNGNSSEDGHKVP